jgi:hypothetical protein
MKIEDFEIDKRYRRPNDKEHDYVYLSNNLIMRAGGFEIECHYSNLVADDWIEIT